eukprot:COSAG03_NODE_39921_length_101_cov_5073.500000_1_plen_25_part_10
MMRRVLRTRSNQYVSPLCVCVCVRA